MSFSRVVITMAAAFVLALGAPAAATAAGSATQSNPTVTYKQVLSADDGRPETIAERRDVIVTYKQVLSADDGRPETIAERRDVIVRVSGIKSGFDWGDAGVGAIAALGLSLVALASWLAVSQRRARRTGSPAIHTDLDIA
ncbi:MAG: hypothetical protein ACLPTJ_19785 [Solirubrobacteraceae bacterium]